MGRIGRLGIGAFCMLGISLHAAAVECEVWTSSLYDEPDGAYRWLISVIHGDHHPSPEQPEQSALFPLKNSDLWNV